MDEPLGVQKVAMYGNLVSLGSWETPRQHGTKEPLSEVRDGLIFSLPFLAVHSSRLGMSTRLYGTKELGETMLFCTYQARFNSPARPGAR